MTVAPVIRPANLYLTLGIARRGLQDFKTRPDGDFGGGAPLTDRGRTRIFVRTACGGHRPVGQCYVSSDERAENSRSRC